MNAATLEPPQTSRELISPDQTTLPDISKVTPLSEADKPLIDDIVTVLKKHGAQHRFGLTLLHQHFDISPDEVLVESTDVKARTQTIKPDKKVNLKSLPVTETSWRLDTGKPMMACVCVKMGDSHSHQSRG